MKSNGGSGEAEHDWRSSLRGCLQGAWAMKRIGGCTR